MYKSFLRPLLFQFDPEKIHHTVTGALNFVNALPGIPTLMKGLYQVKNQNLEREVFGIKFPNPVGLAAGFDKEAKLYKSLNSLGFGFIEIGTVTPKGQPGNPKPRMFRLPEDQGLINRMGFNNEGVEMAVKNLRNRPKNMIIGGNIGKNKVTPNEEALNDYKLAFEALYPYVDYFVVNVSSPNTPNLRDLQDKGPLTEIINALKELRLKKDISKPILLKIAPDLTEGQLDDIVALAEETQLDGIIATNTTIDRKGLKTPENRVKEIGAGGLSGKPVRDKSTFVIKYLYEKLGEKTPIIAVGGIFTGKDALEKLKAGAKLVQVYTGFIYEGPAMIKNINKTLLQDQSWK